MKLFDFEDWELTQDSLKDVLSYNSNTGEFHWLVKPSSRTHIGDRAGSLDAKGYRVIKIARKDYKAHRLAWFYTYGEWPARDLDFINRQPDCNRISNLREATKMQNAGNSKARKGLKGAYWHKREKVWWSNLLVDGRQMFLGHYDTEKEAHAAYCKAAKAKFGEFFYAG